VQTEPCEANGGVAFGAGVIDEQAGGRAQRRAVSGRSASIVSPSATKSYDILD
jgi:hypothetical protein